MRLQGLGSMHEGSGFKVHGSRLIYTKLQGIAIVQAWIVALFWDPGVGL